MRWLSWSLLPREIVPTTPITWKRSPLIVIHSPSGLPSGNSSSLFFFPSTTTMCFSRSSTASRKRPCAIGTCRISGQFACTPYTAPLELAKLLTSVRSWRCSDAVTLRTCGASRRTASSSPSVSLYGLIPSCWFGSAGIVPPKIIITSEPTSCNDRVCPERNPSPNPISSSSEATPHAIPNMVKNDRNRCAQIDPNTCARMSPKLCIEAQYASRLNEVPPRDARGAALKGRDFSPAAHAT